MIAALSFLRTGVRNINLRPPRRAERVSGKTGVSASLRSARDVCHWQTAPRKARRVSGFGISAEMPAPASQRFALSRFGLDTRPGRFRFDSDLKQRLSAAWFLVLASFQAPLRVYPQRFDVHLPVAPQGRARPLWVTGRPSSSDTVCPPYFPPTTVWRI